MSLREKANGLQTHMNFFNEFFYPCKKTEKIRGKIGKKPRFLSKSLKL